LVSFVVGYPNQAAKQRQQHQHQTHTPHPHRNLTARAQRGFAKRHPSITVPVKRVVGQAPNSSSSPSSSSSSPAKALAAGGWVFGKQTRRKYVRVTDMLEKSIDSAYS